MRAARVLLLCCLMACLGLMGTTAALAAPAEEVVAEFPVQHHGRVKPLDTFARVHLLAFYGKRTIKDVSPTEWLLDVLTTPDGSSPHRVFKVRNPEVVTALGLVERDGRTYTFQEVAHAVGKQEQMLRELQGKDQDTLSPVEKQLVELYRNLSTHQEISLSASCLLPLFEVTDPSLAEALGLEAGKKLSYRTMLESSAPLTRLVQELGQKPREEWSAADEELFHLVDQMNRVQGDRFATIFTVLPPMSGSVKDPWASPWSVMGEPGFGEERSTILHGWEELLNAHLSGASGSEAAAADSIAARLASGASAKISSRLHLEEFYNRFEIFYKSLAFYILSFLLVAIGLLFKPGLLRKLAFLSLTVGILLHLAGLLARMIVMGRAPVSNLYESIVFVGVTAAISGLILELFRRDGMGVLIGAIAGAVLHFVGNGYAADGDTMGMLVAVLDSNFWLSTHVVTITIGYGCSLVAGLAGHLYLFFHALDPGNRERLDTLNRNMIGLTVVALFFTLFGTILGGIWADQSWGRFWGWDPKENGALLIVMWQLMLLHGKVNNVFRPPGFALGLVFCNIVVAVAWFGVNLLNVGLHTYGFADNVAIKLLAFCGFELLLGLALYLAVRLRSVKAIGR